MNALKTVLSHGRAAWQGPSQEKVPDDKGSVTMTLRGFLLTSSLKVHLVSAQKE